ncbi:MAG: hypothetical protein JWM53_3307 [bacterium]|nr:hypothetical protein [bacterium]
MPNAKRAPARNPPCVNCGSAVVEAFCAGCGQRTPAATDYSLRTFLHAAIGHLTNYDGRLLTTVRKLFFRPGQLARDHFEGRRASHLDPFRIFVLANVLAWFIVPHTGLLGFSLATARRFAQFPDFWTRMLAVRAQLSHVTVEVLSKRIDAISSSENSVTLLCLVPFAALGVSAVMAGRGYRFVQHLVVTAHFYCIHMLCLIVYIGLLLHPLWNFLGAHAWTAPLVAPLHNIWTEHLAVAPALILYLYFGLQRAYLLSPSESAWRAVVLGVWACTVTRMFFDACFALVLIWA